MLKLTCRDQYSGTRSGQLSFHPQSCLVAQCSRLPCLKRVFMQDAASVRADHPIPAQAGVYYFEVEVISRGQKGYIGIGFSTRSVHLARLPGEYICQCIPVCTILTDSNR